MAQGNKVTFKYLSTGKLTEAQLTQYADAIVFVASENAIYTHGKRFGLAADEAAKITNLETAVAALQKFDTDLRYFSSVVDTSTGTKAGAASPGAALKFTGAGDVAVSVGTDGVKIDGSTLKTAAASAKSAADTAQATADDAVADAAAAQATADQGVADAAAALAKANEKVASVAATANAGIAIGGTATAPTVGIKIDTTTAGNVTLTTGANGLKADVTIPAEKLDGVVNGDKVLSMTGTKVGATLTLKYVEGTKKLQILGIDDALVTEIDATAFVKDGMISKEGTKFDTDTKKLTLAFNTDAGVEAFDLDLSDLVDTYDGANLKLKAPTAATTYAAPAAGDSVDVAIGKLTKGIADAKASGVTSFGGKTGAVTVKGGQTANGTVNLSMSDNELQASIVGLGSAAYTETSAYATATQGGKADTALQSIGKGTDGTYVTTTVGAKGTGTIQTVGVEITTHTVADATTSANGLAVAADVKKYVDDSLAWEEL